MISVPTMFVHDQHRIYYQAQLQIYVSKCKPNTTAETAYNYFKNWYLVNFPNAVLFRMGVSTIRTPIISPTIGTNSNIPNTSTIHNTSNHTVTNTSSINNSMINISRNYSYSHIASSMYYTSHATAIKQ